MYYPGVPIFRSTDLVHWTQIGSVLDRPSQLHVDSAGISRGIFAPVIRYHDGTFYMITTLIDRGGNFIVTATNPAGPWSDPIWLREVDGIDPSIFFDDDGRAYITNNGPPVETPLYEGHRAIWVQEYDVANKKMIGPRSVIVNGGVDLAKKPIWIEAPHILKVKGQYYLICAEGGTADQHSEVVFRSSAPLGPYTPYSGNPILTQRHLDPSRAFPVTSTGHADFVETQNGEWWAVFLGTRPYANDTYNIGRETFLLPVRWVDGWPVILSGNADRAVRADATEACPPVTASIPMGGGNFSVRDDFSERSLAKYWTFMRTVRQPWYDLTSTPGWLTIQARGDDISGPGQPVVRRAAAAAHRGDRVDGDAVRSRAAGRQGRSRRVPERDASLLRRRRAVRRFHCRAGRDVRRRASERQRGRERVAWICRRAARSFSRSTHAAADTTSISPVAPASGSRCCSTPTARSSARSTLAVSSARCWACTRTPLRERGRWSWGTVHAGESQRRRDRLRGARRYDHIDPSARSRRS